VQVLLIKALIFGGIILFNALSAQADRHQHAARACSHTCSNAALAVCNLTAWPASEEAASSHLLACTCYQPRPIQRALHEGDISIGQAQGYKCI